MHLPAGIFTVLLSLWPHFAFPIALAGIDQLRPVRLLALARGLAAIALITGHRAGLPRPGIAVWIPPGLVALLFDAVEGNVVAR